MPRKHLKKVQCQDIAHFRRTHCAPEVNGANDAGAMKRTASKCATAPDGSAFWNVRLLWIIRWQSFSYCWFFRAFDDDVMTCDGHVISFVGYVILFNEYSTLDHQWWRHLPKNNRFRFVVFSLGDEGGGWGEAAAAEEEEEEDGVEGWRREGRGRSDGILFASLTLSFPSLSSRFRCLSMAAFMSLSFFLSVSLSLVVFIPRLWTNTRVTVAASCKYKKVTLQSP